MATVFKQKVYPATRRPEFTEMGYSAAPEVPDPLNSLLQNSTPAQEPTLDDNALIMLQQMAGNREPAAAKLPLGMYPLAPATPAPTPSPIPIAPIAAPGGTSESVPSPVPTPTPGPETPTPVGPTPVPTPTPPQPVVVRGLQSSQHKTGGEEREGTRIKELQDPEKAANWISAITEADPTLRGLKSRFEILNAMAMRQPPSDIPVGMDWTPLAGLVDQWTGSKLAPFYKPPVSGESRFEKLSKMAGESGKQYIDAIGNLMKTGLTEKLEDRKKTLSDMYGISDKALSGGGKGAGGKEPDYIRWYKTVTANNGPIKDSISKLGEAETLSKNIDLNSNVSIQTAYRQLLRLAGDTRPSDADVRAFSGDPFILEVFRQFRQARLREHNTKPGELTSAEKGYLTPVNKQHLINIMNVMRSAAAKKTVEGIKRAAKVSGIAGLDPAKAESFAFGTLGYDPAQLAKSYEEAPTEAKKDMKDMSMGELYQKYRQEEAAKGAKK